MAAPHVKEIVPERQHTAQAAACISADARAIPHYGVGGGLAGACSDTYKSISVRQMDIGSVLSHTGEWRWGREVPIMHAFHCASKPL